MRKGPGSRSLVRSSSLASALRASRASRSLDMVSLGRHRVLMSFEELVAYSVGWRRAARTSMLSRSSSQTLQIQGHGVGEGDVWLPSPIAPGKFMRSVRVMLQEAGFAEQVAKRRSYNAMRRFLPTGADASDLDESISAGIGNWQDSGRRKCSRGRATQLPISKRYAEDKVRTAAGHKRWIVAAVAEALSRKALAGCDEVSWDDIRNSFLDGLAKRAETFRVEQD